MIYVRLEFVNSYNFNSKPVTFHIHSNLRKLFSKSFGIIKVFC